MPIPYQTCLTVRSSAFTKVMQLNLQRVFTLTQKLVPFLEKGASGATDGSTPFADPARIINIGSIDGLRVPTVESYPCAYALSISPSRR